MNRVAIEGPQSSSNCPLIEEPFGQAEALEFEAFMVQSKPTLC